jgi:hypothetical protein
VGWRRLGEEMAQAMYIHVSKCKNGKIKGKKWTEDLNGRPVILKLLQESLSEVARCSQKNRCGLYYSDQELP